ncbi:MAG: transglycosylase domain-containing protein [Dehalococcoidia bacterium]
MAVSVSGWIAYSLLLAAAPPVRDLEDRVHTRLLQHKAPYTSLDEIPLLVQQATIVTEDQRFYDHHGLDGLGILRSILDNLANACFCQGGSTITEQLAKQIYLDGNDGSASRKLRSMLLALKIENYYSKEQILEFYFNTAYYGHGAYGVGAAAEIYWRRSIDSVDLSEAAMLGGLPQAPSNYDPLEYPAAARVRRGEVLKRMVDEGRISRAESEEAGARPVASSSEFNVYGSAVRTVPAAISAVISSPE